MSKKTWAALLLPCACLCLAFTAEAPSQSSGTGRSQRDLAAPSQAPSFSLAVSTPSRIFTPNGDGINDTFTLRFENPSGSILSQKKIFSLQGLEIADFTVSGDETAAIVTLIWDGRDSGGNQVRSGIYIYQVQAEGKTINGTVVVAR